MILDKEVKISVIKKESTPESNNPSVEAIQYALKADDGIEFLRLWNHGEFEAIREEWPDCPKECFIGSEPGYKGDI